MALALTRRRGGIGSLTVLLAMVAWVWVAVVCPVEALPLGPASIAALHQDHGTAPAHLDAGCDEQVHAAAIPSRAPPEPIASAYPPPQLPDAVATEAGLSPGFRTLAVPCLDAHSPPATSPCHAPLGAQAPPQG